MTTSRTSATASALHAARAFYAAFHARCFWSYDKHYVIQEDDLVWVVRCLRAHGGREGWLAAASLCR